MWNQNKALSLHPLRENGVIAQLVEQRTENPCVPGSIPGDATKENSYMHDVTVFFHHFIPEKDPNYLLFNQNAAKEHFIIL